MSVEMGYGTTAKERSFGNVCHEILRCRSYAPLPLFHIPFLQTWSELRSYLSTKKRCRVSIEWDLPRNSVIFPVNPVTGKIDYQILLLSG